MATIYYGSDGTILRVIRFPFEAVYGAPSNAASIEVDPATNQATVQDYLANPAAYTCPGGVLTKNGQAVAVNVASQDYQSTQFLKQAISLLRGTENLPSVAVIQTAFQAVQAGTATPLQTQIALAVTTRLLALLAQALLSNGTLG